MHPSPTARTGYLPSTDVITKGINADVGAFPATKDVYCRQCGFVCNTARNARNVDEFAGETITPGTSLSNGSFEDWTAGSPDSWTVSGAVMQISSDGYFDPSDNGVSALKITRSSSDIALSQAMSAPSDFNSEIVIFRARVKSSTNGVIRLRARVNSADYYSAYNIAQQRFQELAVTVICPAVVSSLTVYILADNANGTAYIDQAIVARSGNSTTSAVRAGCPMCGSYDYA